MVKSETHSVKTVNVSIAQRSEEDSQEILNDGFQQLFNGEESVEAMLYRKNSYREAWNNVNCDINVSLYFYIFKIYINFFMQRIFYWI